MLAWAQGHLVLGAEDDDSTHADEQEVLLHALKIQLEVQQTLSSVNGRTLSLSVEMKQAGELYGHLAHVRNAVRLVATQAVRPSVNNPDPPTFSDVRRGQDLALNDELADRPHHRSALTRARCSSHHEPARWHIRRYDPNGYFEAIHHDEHGEEGPVYHNWVPVPEAVEALLRMWSRPADRDVEIIWDCPRGSLLPFGGWMPSHRGNIDDYDRGASRLMIAM
ncbi:hypothetical protein [Herbidospora cretacea]|uniref:hypothetical protein n=1 Tax=Herbidospora cretacea TaxID=28444 RepID=UPI0012DDDDF5|nr:hypothetical protein [Herbidospora cretacea]